MPFPNAERAVLTLDKITEYLLNVDHPIGGSKAKWFLGLGYAIATPADLLEDLLAIAGDSDDYIAQSSPHGVKYIVRGQLTSPTNLSGDVVTVWIVEPHSSHPRLVTAYPAGASR